MKSYMARVKDVEDREKRPKVDAPAAKRFVKAALWQEAHEKAAQQGQQSASTVSHHF